MNSNRFCRTCKYFVRLSNTTGACHRYPPFASQYGLANYPLVSDSGIACGEFDEDTPIPNPKPIKNKKKGTQNELS